MSARRLWALVGTLLVVASPVAGQAPSEEPISFEDVLFPPELIMQHQRAIGLNDEQRNAITQLIQQLQGRFVALQWELLDDMQTISQTLERPQVDLDRAMDQLDRVLDREKEIKQVHLELLIRIKNVLTVAQVNQLNQLRAAAGVGSG